MRSRIPASSGSLRPDRYAVRILGSRREQGKTRRSASGDGGPDSGTQEVLSSVDSGRIVCCLERTLKPGDIVINTGSAVLYGELPKECCIVAGKQVEVWGR